MDSRDTFVTSFINQNHFYIIICLSFKINNNYPNYPNYPEKKVIPYPPAPPAEPLTHDAPLAPQPKVFTP
jgi:hypothetical protein